MWSPLSRPSVELLPELLQRMPLLLYAGDVSVPTLSASQDPPADDCIRPTSCARILALRTCCSE